MKYWILLTLSSFCGSGIAAKTLLASDLDFATASPFALRKLLERSEGSAVKREAVERAVQNRRMDLIRFLFENPETCLWVQKNVEEITDEAFRDEVALLLIKTDAPGFWADEDSMGSAFWHAGKADLFVPTFQRYLPDSEPPVEALRTDKSRVRTAMLLEAAMAAKKGSAFPPPPPGRTPEPDAVASSSGSPPPGKDSAATKLSAPAEKGSGHCSLWPAILAAALSAVAGYLLGRGKAR